MSHVDQIQAMWSSAQQGDLAVILREILELVDEAKNQQEDLPFHLELDILLNANYALGFGGHPAEARVLGDLFHRILSKLQEPTSSLDDLDVPAKQFHRLGCTLASATISILTADEHEDASTAYDIISWQEFSENTETDEILRALITKMTQSLQYGKQSTWKLETFSFLVTLLLLHQDLEDTEPQPIEIEEKLQAYVTQVDTESELWQSWRGDWLEKSDYYRFVTLMMLNRSQPEERWLETIQAYFD